MRKTLQVIDSISEWVGSTGRWWVVILIAITFWDVLLRYVFGHATMWAFETGMMLGGAIGAFGWAYCQKHNLHIRVDVIYIRLSPKKKAIINVIGTLVFFMPLYIFLIKTAGEWTVRAWVEHEVWQEGFWFPPAGPSRTVILLGIVTLFFQMLVTLVRDLCFIIKGVRP